MVRVAINGFGRIGRQSLKALLEREIPVEVVAVNDLADASMNAHLFKHDSTYGAYRGVVEHTEDAVIVDGRAIKVLAEPDPTKLPWADLGVDIVLESTGKFRDPGKAEAHLGAGARKVIISAPARGADVTIVLGANGDAYDPERHNIISNASCTTNCLVPAVKVVHDLATIERGLMNTVHSYTTSQRLLDMAHKDPRRARAAGQNIVPTTSGATTSPVRWSTERSFVAASGDLGVSIGTIHRNSATPEGQPASFPFFTVWRRDSANAPWRYIAE